VLERQNVILEVIFKDESLKPTTDRLCAEIAFKVVCNFAIDRNGILRERQ
jgi:hypothetical protein